MENDMKQALAILAVGLACSAFAEKRPIERYQQIIDRQMFGPLPKDFDPEKMPSEVSKSSGSGMSEKELTQEQAKLQSAVHFSVINVDREGKAVVGFTDNSDPKAPVHYYLRVGESQNGWTVKEADPEHATMTIVKDDVEVSLTLGDNSGKGGGKTSAVAAAKLPTGTPRKGLLGGGGSLSARRALRRQQEAEEEKKRADEAAAKEEERKALVEQEKAEREAERQQQRQQLMAIQEELRKAREEKERQRQTEDSNDNNETE